MTTRIVITNPDGPDSVNVHQKAVDSDGKVSEVDYNPPRKLYPGDQMEVSLHKHVQVQITEHEVE